jgi:PIN domain nuclease of toxin-antitoxin system
LRILLDSHICFWLALKRERLSTIEFGTIADPANDIAFSSVTIWELSIKWEKRFVSGVRKGQANPKDVLRSLIDMQVLAIDLTAELAAATLQTPIAHRDPFDGLLLAVAQETGRKLLTRDNALRGHPLAYFAE